ncbi:mitotic spindle assembly checkpoint protein MAD2B [Arapaima gigas]
MEKIQVIKDFPWIVADEQEVHMCKPRLIPLKTMTSDIVKMQLYVEERAQKAPRCLYHWLNSKRPSERRMKTLIPL